MSIVYHALRNSGGFFYASEVRRAKAVWEKDDLQKE